MELEETINSSNQDKKATSSTGNEFNTSEFLLYLWHKKWWILICLAICLGYSYYNYTLKPTQYASEAQVMFIFDDQGSSTGSTSIQALSEIKGGGYVNLNNELAVIKSPALMEDVVEKLNLTVRYSSSRHKFTDDLYENSPVNVYMYNIPADSSASFFVKRIDDKHVKAYGFTKGGKEISGPALRIPLDCVVETPVGQVAILATGHYGSFPEELFVDKQSAQRVAERMAHSVQTISDKEENTVVTIKYTSTSAQLSTDVLNALIEAYNELWAYEKRKSANSTSEFINGRLVKIESELSGIDKSIAGKKVGTSPTMEDIYTPRGDDNSDKAYEINTNLAVAENARDRINSAFSSGSMVGVSTGNASIDSQLKDYNTLLGKYNYAYAESGENNSVVRDYKDQIEHIKASVISGLNSLISDYRLKASRISSLGSSYRSRGNAIPQREADLLPIERQQKVKENLYLYLLQKREENELTKMISVNNTRVIQPPHSIGKVGPKKLDAVAIGVISGLAIPLAVLFLLFYFDTRVKSRADLKKITVPFLGEMPDSSKTPAWKKRIIRIFHKDKRKKDDKDLTVMVKERSRTFINEAFRMLRTNLDFMAGKHTGSRCIMSASLQAGSGKTFITMNLAASLTLKGKKVVVVDADLRHASLSKYAGNPSQGVTSYLTGKVPDIATVTIRDKKSGLIDIVPVGAIPPNPVELLLSEEFGNMIEELRKNYDYIFLDCPPYSMLSDTRIIGKYADTTLFVVRAGLLLKSALPEIEEIYKSSKLPNMAVILNGIDVKNTYYANRYGSNYGYGKSSGYYIEEDEENKEVAKPE